MSDLHDEIYSLNGSFGSDFKINAERNSELHCIGPILSEINLDEDISHEILNLLVCSETSEMTINIDKEVCYRAQGVAVKSTTEKLSKLNRDIEKLLMDKCSIETLTEVCTQFSDKRTELALLEEASQNLYHELLEERHYPVFNGLNTNAVQDNALSITLNDFVIENPTAEPIHLEDNGKIATHQFNHENTHISRFNSSTNENNQGNCSKEKTPSHVSNKITTDTLQGNPFSINSMDDLSFIYSSSESMNKREKMIEDELNFSFNKIMKNDQKHDSSFDLNEGLITLSNDVNRISTLVHELIMKKYEENLRKIKQRSLKRRAFRKTSILSDYNEEIKNKGKFGETVNYFLDNSSTDSGLNSSTDLFLIKNTTNCSEMKKKTKNIEQETNEVLYECLKTPTDDSEEKQHYYSNVIYEQPSTYNTERSIGTTNISALLSTTGQRSHRISSIYSTIDTAKNKNRWSKTGKPNVARPLFESISVSQDSDYGNMDNVKIHSEEEELMKEIALQCEIIQQISKALKICRAKRQFLGGDIHIEAEKILLAASVKRDVMYEYRNKINSYHLQTRSTLTVQNLQFSLKPKIYKKRCKKYGWNFLCIVHSGPYVKTSNIVTEENGKIVFKECFQFEDISSDLEIYINIYALALKKRKVDECTTNNMGLKFMRRQSTNNLYVEPSFKLLGQSAIRSYQFTQNCFRLSQLPLKCIISAYYTAEIQNSLKINITEKGFLTIGIDCNKCPIWSRRWCVLDSFCLQYWNHPNEENVTKPISEIDLNNCITKQVKSVERDICSRPRTLFLEIKVHSVTKKYFLSADTVPELRRWEHQINLVLNTLRKID